MDERAEFKKWWEDEATFSGTITSVAFSAWMARAARADQPTQERSTEEMLNSMTAGKTAPAGRRTSDLTEPPYPKSPSGRWSRKQTDAMIAETGRVFCSHGMHSVAAENASRYKTSSGAVRWICNQCKARRKAPRRMK